ncbi:MAG: NADP-dependent oxidoreductase [Acidimicrobiales bacterium]
MDSVNRQIVLISRPAGMVEDSNFELRTAPVPALTPGTFLVQNVILSIDPAQRAFLNESGAYGGSIPLGAAVWGPAAGVVVESRHDQYAPGDLVEGWFGWQDFAVSDGTRPAGFGKIPKGVSPVDALSVLGLTALTAYFGMTEIGAPKPGEVVAVSAAAGATGSVAAQIARICGATVIGIAGGPEKCAWLKEEAKLDFTIDYKNENVAARLADLAPGGIDVFFDNVGGEILDAALENLAQHGRIVQSGDISSGYTGDDNLPPGPKYIAKLAIKRGRIEGFVVGDYRSQFPLALSKLQQWLADGDLAHAVDVLDGLEQAPAGLRRVFEGKNLGKQLVKIRALPMP